jgi:hypothetical protein
VNVISPRVVFVEERRFLEPIRPTTVVVNNTTIINKTVINKGPDTTIIEKASGRKIQTAPVRELRSKEEAKVVVKHPTPTPTPEKAAPTPVRNQAEKTLPAVEPRRIEKPAVTTAEPQPPVTKKEVRQADKPIPVTKPAEENRVQPEKASETGSEKAKSAPAAVEAKPATKPETKPDAKVESKPAAERPAAAKEPTEQKAGKDDEKKD